MNNSRRKEISEIMDKLSECCDAIENIGAQIQEVKDDEQEAYDSLPESIQGGERGYAMEGVIEELDSAINCVEGVKYDIDSAIDHLSTAMS